MKLKYKFAIQEVMGFHAAVTVGKDAAIYSNVLSLNESGKEIFECLMKGDCTEEDIVAHLKDIYEGEDAVIRKSVAETIAKLREADIIID